MSQQRPLTFFGVAFAFLATMLGTTLPTPLYPLYQTQFGFSQLIITVIFAAYAVGVIAALLVTGRWSDQLGRRPILLGGLFAAMISDAVFLQADGLGAMLAGRVLSGLSAGVFTGTATVAVMELAPSYLKRHAALAATAANMGGLGLGPVVAGLCSRYLPDPLWLPYLLHLGLAGLAMLAIWQAPETVTRPERIRLRLQRLSVPTEVRAVFVPAAIAGFAGFSVLGFFTATAPAFMGRIMDVSNLLAIGVVAGLPFFASTVGQLAQERVPLSYRLPLGCVILLLGVVAIGAGIALASLTWFVCGAVVAGIGQGIAFRAGLGEVVAASPLTRRAEVTSSFFVVAYVAISLPVVGIGVTARLIGLQATGEIFAALVALLVLMALVLLRRQRRPVMP
ncbi:MFS transporter [Aidingimonas halophila]|uniref:MFS transporter n=1 Tax=Aidingimonas halophila TaxID=574349 RepID=UPI0019840D27|nr:MFS transporter [Aidingimonas halophila]GHC28433.1 MFS transporter [Aidingimonas halophila]